MEFTLMDLDHSVGDIERLCGYALLSSERSKFKLVRKIDKEQHPRFHLLVEILNGGDRGHRFILSMESSSRSHGVISEGSLVKKEVERIKESLAKIQG